MALTRVTMLKIDEQKLTIALQGFKTLTQTQAKDGHPYIISMKAGPAHGPLREQGYTLVTQSVFRSEADVKFYETECPAHNAYRAYLKEKAPVEGLMMVYFGVEEEFSIDGV